jgi:Tol biopolymer transport system component
MKIQLRFSLLIASALLITIGLSGCGGSHSLPFITATTSFAYLQDTSTAQSETKGMRAGSRHALAVLHARTHQARKRLAETGVDIGSGTIDLYVMDTSAGTNTKLNPQSAAFYNVQLSYDGTKLLFVAEDSAGYAQIYLADAKFLTLTQLTTGKADHLNASLSKDGTMIAYDTYADDSSAVSTIPATGGEPTAIALPTLSEAFGPVFTPDGKKILFTGWTGETSFVYSVDLDGTGLTQLTQGAYWDGTPNVSPDGTRIAFERDGEDTEDIAVVGIGGESTANPVTMLTSNGMSWQPQYLGEKILFMSWKDDPSRYLDKIYEMNGDGSNLVQLTTSTMEDCFNWWYWD